MRGLRLRRQKDGKISELDCEGLFVAVGLIPENEAFKDLVRLNNYGYIEAGEDCLTGRDGIFTAGAAGPKLCVSLQLPLPTVPLLLLPPVNT